MRRAKRKHNNKTEKTKPPVANWAVYDIYMGQGATSQCMLAGEKKYAHSAEGGRDYGKIGGLPHRPPPPPCSGTGERRDAPLAGPFHSPRGRCL